MTASSPSSPPHDALGGQERIWKHFQNRAPDRFAAAEPRLDFLVRQVRRHCAGPRPVVLNVGVGSGYFERAAARQSWEVHSLDPDAEAIGALAGSGVEGHVGFIERIPLADRSCDCVVASEVLEHLTEEQGQLALKEIARVLKGDGVFLGTTPYDEDLAAGEAVCPRCGEVFHRWGHHRSFTVESLRRELSQYFSVEAIRRMAFAALCGRGLVGSIKSWVRLVLARLGQQVAVPSLFWCAVKRAEGGSLP